MTFKGTVYIHTRMIVIRSGNSAKANTNQPTRKK